MKTSKTYSIILSIIIMLFVLSFSIALPIWCRFFYYIQIDSLNIVEDTGWSKEIIVNAFSELMDYLNFNKPFSTGELKYSESGMSHFADCKKLFDLDIGIFFVTLIFIVVSIILNKKKVIKPYKFFGQTSGFFAGIAAVIVPSIFGIFVAIDFDKAFAIFHKVFFPGKNNWVFDSRTDEIIDILPETFFLNCGILIISSVLVLSISLVIYSIALKKKYSNKAVETQAEINNQQQN